MSGVSVEPFRDIVGHVLVKIAVKVNNIKFLMNLLQLNIYSLIIGQYGELFIQEIVEFLEVPTKKDV